MLILRRLSIWILETSLEAALLSVVLISLFGCDEHAYGKCLGINFIWIGTMFFGTGYLFSTGIVRAVWRGATVWLYPVVAVMLFFVHFEILNHAAGGMFDPSKRAVIRTAGGGVVLLCTMAGSLALQRWKAGEARSKRI